jgi:hypothetical protein
MQYLCLVYCEEAPMPALSEEARQTIMDADRDYREALRESGRYIASSPLQTDQTAMTIRVRRGELLITDGPFAETKEQLGAFYLIEARDLNDAIRVAATMPAARLGCIEVRPLANNEGCHSHCERDPRH